MSSRRRNGRVMSNKVLAIKDNDDVVFKLSIAGKVVFVKIDRVAIENCKFENVEKYTDFSNEQREDLTVNMLVWLASEEAHARLDSEYSIIGMQLDQLLGE